MRALCLSNSLPLSQAGGRDEHGGFAIAPIAAHKPTKVLGAVPSVRPVRRTANNREAEWRRNSSHYGKPGMLPLLPASPHPRLFQHLPRVRPFRLSDFLGRPFRHYLATVIEKYIGGINPNLILRDLLLRPATNSRDDCARLLAIQWFSRHQIVSQLNCERTKGIDSLTQWRTRKMTLD
jgi:hypothetical protein